MDPYVSMSQQDYRTVVMHATLGRVLGRNIERAAAAWALIFSYLLVAMKPGAVFFDRLEHFLSIPTWGWIVGVLSAARTITLIVNGWWPVTLQVRIAFSAATLFLVWAVLVALSWVSTWSHGLIYPSATLAPFAATVEVLCFLALRTRLEAEGSKGSSNDGHGVGGDHYGSGEPPTGVR